MTERTYTVSPYEAPESDRDARPAVIFWFRMYAATLTLVSLALVVLSAWVAYVASQASIFDPQTGRTIAGGSADQAFAIPLLLVALVLTGFHAVATFVPYKPWGWSLGMIVIAMGCMGGSIIFALPLLVYWMKPMTKAAFMRI